MTLSTKENKAFRTIGHELKPVVIISQRLHDNLHQELNRALNDHELIKVKINVPDREDRKAIVDELVSKHKAELVQMIGKIALLYRKAAKQNEKLSNVVRYHKL